LDEGFAMAERVDTIVTERSDVVMFPPVIPVLGFVLGVLVEKVLPADTSIAPTPRAALSNLGGVLLLVGAAGFAWMVLTMKRARTPIHNSETPTRLVQSGPFGWTRNPMYLFGSIAYAGLALLLIEPWALVILPLVLAVTHYGVVLKEEASLEQLFGDAYQKYKARVPRWL
jgi:protein-S-isoprenylcysteine O-methyltransferase Ste14